MHYLKNSLMLAAFMMPLSMLTAPLPKPADKGDKAGDIPASNSEAYQMPVYVQESDFQLPDHRGAYVDYPDGTSKWISLQDPHFRSHILGVIQDDAKRVQALIVQEMKHRDEVPGITSASMSQPSMPNTGYIIPLRTPERTPRGEF